MTTPRTSNLPAGIAAAVVGALLGAIGWAVLTSVSNYKIGYAAVGVGALAGLLGGKAGGGALQLPPIAAGIGLVGCFVGDVLTDAHEFARAVTDRGGSLSMFKVLKEMLLHPSDVGWPIYKAGFGGLDVLFYAFAALAAFRLATQHGLIARQGTPAQTTWAPPAPSETGFQAPPTSAQGLPSTPVFGAPVAPETPPPTAP